MNRSNKIYVSYIAISLAMGIAPCLSSNDFQDEFLKKYPGCVSSLAADDPKAQTKLAYYLIMNSPEDDKKAERDRAAVRYLKRAVAKDNLDAIIILGNCYKTSLGCPNNNQYKSAAVDLFRMAASAGRVEGKRLLADCLANAIGCDDSFENKAEALSIYRKLAEQGNFEAILALPIFLMNSIGCEKNEGEAVAWYRRAAEKGHFGAMNNLAGCLREGLGCEIDMNEAMVWLRKAADGGDPIVVNNLAYCLQVGMGCKIDEIGAVAWYRLAAEKGHFGAMDNLGDCLRRGIGCRRNEEEAVEWYRRAAEKGHFDAMNKLGGCLREGNGCKKNEAEAFAWYLRGAMQGNANSMFDLGYCFWSGIGCEIEEEEAVKWYRRAVEKGHYCAMNHLGDCLREGTGCRRNEQEAVTWYRKAAEGGNPLAMSSLGSCLNHGLGCLKDEKEAVTWFRKAAVSGHPIAMTCLGSCLNHGIGCLKDEKEALVWYKKASDAGYPDATLHLGIAYFKGMGVERNHKLALYYLDKVQGRFRVNAMIGFIFLQDKNYEKALESYRTALKTGDNVDIKLLEYLETKVRSVKDNVKAAPKAKTKNSIPQLAIKAQKLELEACQATTKKQFHLLLNKLEKMNERASLTVGTGFDSTAELIQVKKLKEQFKEILAQEFSAEWTTLKKLGYVKLLSKMLKDLEEKILSAEQELENETHIAALQKTLKEEQDNYSPMEVAGRADNYFTKETKVAAEKAEQAKKDRKHKQNMKPHTKPSHPKSKDVRLTDKDDQTEKKKDVVAPRPFATIGEPTKKIKADISKTARKNVYKIRDIIRESKSKDDALGRLDKLVGKFDFKELKDLKYAGVPDAEIAYQMRIDDKYRVIIAFKAVTSKVYEQGPDGQNSNNPIDKVVYKLCGNTIFIDDPH
jgi:TPR repeat protein